MIKYSSLASWRCQFRSAVMAFSYLALPITAWPWLGEFMALRAMSSIIGAVKAVFLFGWGDDCQDVRGCMFVICRFPCVAFRCICLALVLHFLLIIGLVWLIIG